MVSNILLADRTDFLGSNFVAKMGTFIYGKLNNHDIFHDNNMLYKDSMFIAPFIQLTKERSNCKESIIEYDEKTQQGNVRLLQARPVVQLKQDLVSYFRENYKKEFFEIISTIAKERNYKLPWNDSSRIACIHIRLYDDHWHEGATHSDYDGSGSSHYMRRLMENDNIDAFSKKEVVEYCKKNNFFDALRGEHPDRQVAIDINKLNCIIKNFKNLNPEKEIHVVTKLTTNPENKKYVDLCNEYNVPIHSSDDYDYDLWLMINSDILALSKSTYSLVAGYFHQGSTVHYPLWGVFTSAGLYTNYDKSGWTYYI
jgi:hypothetical protein